MKVFPLRVGRTKVPYGQFYGGHDGFSVLDLAGDKSSFIWVPIHAYLIEHPTVGPMLLDTGIAPAQAGGHDAYYGGTVMQYFTDEDEYDLPAEERIEAQLARHGRHPEDIRHIIVTHFHEDHIGALPLFPDAEIVLSRGEYDARDSLIAGLVPLAFSKSVAQVRSWRPVDFTGPEIGGFEGSYDLFGDGSVVLLPTPGHSPGSTSALVELGGGRRALLAGDALYTVRHLAVDDVMQMQVQNGAKPVFTDTVRRIQWLHRLLPGLVVLPAHDHTPYGAGLVRALLDAEGELTDAAYAAAKAYEAETFDPAYRLNPARRPRFVPDPAGGTVGTVTGTVGD
ncbi:N-acyl homoserine lactonase family protein [Streptomyces sp. NPDC102270]|uniref:N-acyl homoserine lactonase family protein n=1 Tax=Streptomyces sp. NPDC102270 TaxID=3366150 RepID=UPI00382132C9